MFDHTSQTETNWWTSLKNDDPEALGYFYDTYVDKLFISAMAISNDRELIKDTLQDVFVELWKYRKTISEVKNPQAYLTRILKSLLFKKLKARRLSNIDADLATVAADELNAEELMIFSGTETINHSRLQNAVSTLSKKQQLVLKLRFYQNMSYSEIASKLGMKDQSVNNLVFRTFRRLRGVMSHLLF
jgi:RNA polymerase sigma factor (sigma-70 family)